MDDFKFSGVGVALITLFSADGALDAEATADLAGRLVDVGIKFVVVAGTTGEAASLELPERSALTRTVRKLLPDTPILVGTGAMSTRQAVMQTESAIDEGADGVLALSLPRDADQVAYYRAVAHAASDVPVLAYHFPAVSAPGIPVSVLRDLPVRGVKDSSGDPARLIETMSTWDQPFFTGSAPLAALAGHLGAAGAILALANAEPEDCIAAFAGDKAAALRLSAGHQQATAKWPGGLKALTAKRFGTSLSTRMG